MAGGPQTRETDSESNSLRSDHQLHEVPFLSTLRFTPPQKRALRAGEILWRAWARATW
jgi:hypothetical protein